MKNLFSDCTNVFLLFYQLFFAQRNDALHQLLASRSSESLRSKVDINVYIYQER